MYQFLRPKFRFSLFVIDNTKTTFYKNQNQNNNNQNSSHLPVICHADTYEIKEDGSIVFYQSIKTDDDKRFKVPVLSYPHGKWDACILLDDTNDFPVFKGYSIQQSVNPIDEAFEQASQHATREELSQLNENFAQSISNNTHNISNTHQQAHQILNSFGQNTGNGMPGINTNNNQDFKKQKEEWIESEIKAYTKDNELFNVFQFLNFISKKQQNKMFKVSETDVTWAGSKLIRNKSIMSRKFADPVIQKTLALILPDIMKRQWDGKMVPIVQILQEKEETKNVTAIDLAVWMVQNNY